MDISEDKGMADETTKRKWITEPITKDTMCVCVCVFFKIDKNRKITNTDTAKKKWDNQSENKQVSSARVQK